MGSGARESVTERAERLASEGSGPATDPWDVTEDIGCGDEEGTSYLPPQETSPSGVRRYADGGVFREISSAYAPPSGRLSGRDDPGGTAVGRPIMQEANARRETLQTAGTARIRALTDMFGEDALVLGHLLFSIPPLSIRISKGNLLFRWKSLRTKEATVVSSGHGEAFIYINLAFVGQREIDVSLRQLIVLFRAVPFCPIENAHIRRMMIPESPEDGMAVCLESLQLDAVAGQTDAIYANLTCRWFNYKPFSNHFWLRETYEPANRQFAARLQASLETGEPEIGVAEVEASERSRRTFADLSALQHIEDLDVTYPPEMDIRSAFADTGERSDPTLARTSPVVYPFNSSAFLHRVENYGVGHNFERTSGEWSDTLTMRWNSYARVPWPRELLTMEPGEIVPPPEQPTGSRERSAEPEVLPGDRNIILLIGDSITLGYLGILDAGSLTITQYTGSRLTRRPGYDYYRIARQGAHSSTLRSATREALQDSTIRSRLACAVIAVGANDGPGASADAVLDDTISNLEQIVEMVIGAGGIAMVMPVWPMGDDPGPPALTSQLHDHGKDSLAARNGAIMLMGQTGGDSVVARNPHPVLTTSAFTSRLDGPWSSDYRPEQVAGGIINLHPNAAGYIRIAAFVNAEIPWSSIPAAEE